MDSSFIKREPVAVSAIVVGVGTAIAAFLSAWGGGQDWRLALATALGILVASIGGGAVARSKAYSPVTVETIIEEASQVTQTDNGPREEDGLQPGDEGAPVIIWPEADGGEQP